MSFLRRLIAGLSNLLLGLSLFILAFIVTLLATLLSPNYIKTTLDKSGFYDNIVGSGLKLASVEPSDNANANFNSSVIVELTPTIQKVVTPELLQTNTEKLINGFDSWLSSKTKNPDFLLDVASVKTNLISNLATHFNERVLALPDCPLNKDVASYDLITTACKPPIELTQADYAVTASNFADDMPFLDKNQLAFSDFDSQDNLKNNRIWQKIPAIYGAIKLTPLILAGIAVICMVIILLVDNRRIRAIRIIGHAFLISGAMLLVTGAIVILYLGRDIFAHVGGTSAEQVAFAKEIFVPISHNVANSFGSWAVYFGVGYAICSAICYFIAHQLRISQLKKVDSREASLLKTKDTQTFDKTPAPFKEPPGPTAMQNVQKPALLPQTPSGTAKTTDQGKNQTVDL